MILSDKHKFIFLKTKKTAGTSIEVELSQLVESNAVVTPFGVPENDHMPRNYIGLWNPIPEFLDPKIPARRTIGDLVRRRRFYSHIPARLLRRRVGRKKWRTYYKFCVERDYLTKTKSHINMKIFRGKCSDKDDYFQIGDFCLNEGFYAIDGEVIVDRIVSFENMGAQLKKVLETLGIKNFSGVKSRAKGDIRTTKISFNKVELEKLKTVFKSELNTLKKCKDAGVYSE